MPKKWKYFLFNFERTGLQKPGEKHGQHELKPTVDCIRWMDSPHTKGHQTQHRLWEGRAPQRVCLQGLWYPNKVVTTEENNYWSRRTAGCCMIEGAEGVQVWSRVVCWKEGVENLMFTCDDVKLHFCPGYQLEHKV